VAELAEDIGNIVVTSGSFAAMKMDGSVHVWGNLHTGADVSTAVLESIQGAELIVGSASTFAALLPSGHVVTWGNK
jgi:hypothetical protein